MPCITVFTLILCLSSFCFSVVFDVMFFWKYDGFAGIF